ncbi:2-methoxy-6-polyprenyl-1 4-benzoquinol methylase mitochondrial [Fasciola hepatica]|uniref:2-methoxy-6-polyprenyl-1 4-benzoquinol methylase mitochondrial n=1 Tax=Fasciola hepatica TaxID=6192 RepID=A0A2H1C2E9_FASHE|nr:2-methoxy-6-polyprenyl-1 4-benzoquinol methylase mitochondrial [Fasciola hepatica]
MLSRISHCLRLISPLSTSSICANILRRPATTHFGFQNVDEEEKQKKVNHVFESVAEKYDLMNDAMSFGIHRLWKDCFVRQIMPTDNLRCLDVAGGTGDIAFRISKFSEPIRTQNNEASQPIRSGPHITLCDINPSMMEVGKSRAEKLGLKNISWVEGNAEKLPFEDNTFDLYTIAFGIRNCTHIDKVLTEANRVLRPYGRFFCLEFSRVTNPVLRM